MDEMTERLFMYTLYMCINTKKFDVSMSSSQRQRSTFVRRMYGQF